MVECKWNKRIQYSWGYYMYVYTYLYLRGGFAYRLAMHKLPIITKMLDKIAHVRKFNHIFLSSLTLMAINAKQQAKIITKPHTTTTAP